MLHLALGNVTCQSICQALAPKVSAASSPLLSCVCSNARTSLATNGNVTNAVASTIPGTANMIRISCSDSQGPNQPCRPKSKTNNNPETTGDTLNGKSMIVTSSCFPRKSNLAISHAATIPNAALRGTAMAAVKRVSCMADTVAG